jgi:hypothetical protein
MRRCASIAVIGGTGAVLTPDGDERLEVDRDGGGDDVRMILLREVPAWKRSRLDRLRLVRLVDRTLPAAAPGHSAPVPLAPGTGCCRRPTVEQLLFW